MKLPTLAECRKFLVALIGVAGNLLAAGLLHGNAEQSVIWAVSIATAVLVFLVPNADPPAGP